MQVTLLCPWIGERPEWLPQFRARMAWSAPLVKFVFIPGMWASFRHRIVETLGVHPAKCVEPIKLCDYRPAFGLIFKDEIGDSDWWGWCDLDCVFGNFARFLTPERLGSCDLITDHSSIVNGPLTLIRNSEFMNLLFWEEANASRIMIDHEYHNFDESGRPGGKVGRYNGFSRAVSLNEHVRALYLNAHSHDREDPAPKIVGGWLMQGSREILTYHFPREKRWPL